MAEVVPGISMPSEFQRRYLHAYVVDGHVVDAGTRFREFVASPNG